MTDHDDFFERLRRDAQPLRQGPDAATLRRIRARIEAELAPRPTVTEVLTAWFRPLATAMAAVALTAAITFAALSLQDEDTYADAVEVVMAGETYSVGH
jgi:hypothetical protein